MLKCSPHRDTIIRMLQDGDSQNAIAKEIGVSRGTLRTFIRGNEDLKAIHAAGVGVERRYPKHREEAPLLCEDHRHRIEEMLAGGSFLTAVAKEIGVAARTLRRYMEREENLAWGIGLKAQAAEVFVEEGMRILDETKPESSAAVTLAKERAGFRKWLAGKWSEEYSERQPVVEINLTTMEEAHLDALKDLGRMIRPPLVAVEAPLDAEFEVMPALSPPSLDDLL